MTTPFAVTTPDECVAFVNQVGLCAWRRWDRLPSLPAVADATPWAGDDHALMMATWFWKDDLHIERRLFYGQLLGNGVPAWVSLDFLPYLIAAQGDNDPRTLYENNQLSAESLALYEHIARNGPTASNALPGTTATRTRHLVPLQQRFLLAKHSLTGRTRGNYGYVWGLCDACFPNAFTQAARLSVPDARAHIMAHLRQHDPALSDKQIARLLRW